MLTYLCPGCFDVPESAIGSKFLRDTEALGAIRELDLGPLCAEFFHSLKSFAVWLREK